MNKASIQKILNELKEQISNSHKVKMHYKDGTSETIEFLEAICRYTENHEPGTPPEVTHIDFIGNYKNQGILPGLLLYLAGVDTNTDGIEIDTSYLDLI